MSRRIAHILIVLLVAIFSLGHGMNALASKKSSKAKAKDISLPSISHNDSLRYKIFYLEAIKQQISGNYDGAYNLLKHCLNINPHAAEAYFVLSFYDGILGGDSLAMQDIKNASEINPENNAFLERLATGYVRTDNYDGAIKVYEKLSKNSPERSDILDILIQLYAQRKDYDNMLATIIRMETLEGSNEETALAKMQVYSMQGKKEEELNSLKLLAEQHPFDMNYRVMIGNWLLQNGSPEDAFKEYSYALEQEPDNTTAQMSLIDYYKEIGQKQKADSIQEDLLINPNTPIESKMLLMRIVVAENEKDFSSDSLRVLNLFKKIIAEPQKTPDMVELYAAYMSLKNMPQDSISQALEKVLEIAPDNVSARLQLIQAKWAEQDYDEVISLSRGAIDYNPDEIAFYYFLGLAYMQKDDDKDALETMRRGISVADEDSSPSLVSDLYAIMGDLLHNMGQAKQAYQAYDSCLQWKDDHIGCLNNYAYYLSVEDKDLTKAEQMSYRTIQAEPSNSTYLDTFAWILFKQGRYSEALQYIDMAISNDSTESAVIIEHAGDIHAVNGDIEKAVDFWQKALEKGAEDEALIKRKIKLKKYEK